MNKPIVTVACTTYNQENYIKQTIEGFLNQVTNFNIEIIIHDDASTDGTSEIIKEYALKYPKIIIPIFQHQNQYSQGIRPLYKFIIPKVKGKYIALCEGDDYWTDPYKLQKQVDFLEANEDYGLVYTEVDFYYEESKVLKKDVFKSGIVNSYSDLESYLINTGYRAPCTWLTRTSLITTLNYPKEYVDGSFVIMLEIMTKAKVKFLPDSTAVYRYVCESASHSSKLAKRHNFGSGLFKIQKYYLNKLNLSEDVFNRIRHRMYPLLIPGALVLRKITLLEEARIFLRVNKNGIKEYLLYYMLLLPYISGKTLKMLYKIKGRL